MKDAPYDEHRRPEGDPADELSIVEELPQKRATFIFHAVSLHVHPGDGTTPRDHDLVSSVTGYRVPFRYFVATGTPTAKPTNTPQTTPNTNPTTISMISSERGGGPRSTRHATANRVEAGSPAEGVPHLPHPAVTPAPCRRNLRGAQRTWGYQTMLAAVAKRQLKPAQSARRRSKAQAGVEYRARVTRYGRSRR